MSNLDRHFPRPAAAMAAHNRFRNSVSGNVLGTPPSQHGRHYMRHLVETSDLHHPATPLQHINNKTHWYETLSTANAEYADTDS